MIPRYARPDMTAIWSPETKFRIWFEIEAHAADALAEFGVIPKDAARIVWEKGRNAKFDVERIDAIERDVTTKMACAREEIFGPVATLFRFNTEEDAVRMANDTEYGLAAYYYSKDMGRIMRVAEALEYGILGINEGIISTEVAPFGGMKESGIGREGSKYGIEDYLEIKYLALGGLGMA